MNNRRLKNTLRVKILKTIYGQGVIAAISSSIL